MVVSRLYFSVSFSGIQMWWIPCQCITISVQPSSWYQRYLEKNGCSKYLTVRFCAFPWMSRIYNFTCKKNAPEVSWPSASLIRMKLFRSIVWNNDGGIAYCCFFDTLESINTISWQVRKSDVFMLGSKDGSSCRFVQNVKHIFVTMRFTLLPVSIFCLFYHIYFAFSYLKT